MEISVFGMGKIGLPLAVQYAQKGNTVHGVDINPTTVQKINNAVEPFPGEANLGDYLKEVVGNRSLVATTNADEAVAKSQFIVVAVPLFVDENAVPDFSAIDAATVEIGKGLQRDATVIYETTLPVGATRNRIQPLLEKESGLTVERDFHLAFSPERVLTGRVFQDLRRYPKLVGGIDHKSSLKAVEFYEDVLEFDDRPDLDRKNGVWNLGTCEAAEMAKLAETTYRDVNIGLANQFAMFASKQNIDIREVIQASNSQPFSHIHEPGIAVGGHCIPIYPRLYLWNDPDASIVEQARETNAAMPKYAVSLLLERCGDLHGQEVVVLGVSYREGVKEDAFSGVYPIVKSILDHGGTAFVHDPLYSSREIEEMGFMAYKIGDPVDYVVLHTAHPEYLSWNSEMFPSLKGVLDGRSFLDPDNWVNIKFITLG